jgi:2-isopropylmalate synthase
MSGAVNGHPVQDADRVCIFDTTLRDGEQAPGAALTPAHKLEIARALARLRVDVIEAGFPAASPGDFAAVRSIAEQVGADSDAPVICGLARSTRPDIDRCWQAIEPAARTRIHTFMATSRVLMDAKLNMTPDQVMTRVAEMVGHARSLTADVEFSAEDAGRSDPAFLYEVLDIAIRAGATTINIPDTVGYCMPEEYGALIRAVRASVPGIEGVVLSVHCHDDLGLATANTLAGIRAGARQAEVAINGIGERAGNCSLEEVVMILHTRAPLLGLGTQIETTQLTEVSRLVSARTGIAVAPNKAIIGANAFAHESGIHQAAMLKDATTYEVMRPETVGLGASKLCLGKLSGRHALAARLAELGHTVAGAELDRVFVRFKELADRKKHLTDADLEGLLLPAFGRAVHEGSAHEASST